MPSIINGPIKISSVSGGATINFGDSGIIAPKSASKTTSGSGGTVGDFSNVYTGTSNTNSTSSSGVDTTTNSKV
jgi:spore germination protein PF